MSKIATSLLDSFSDFKASSQQDISESPATEESISAIKQEFLSTGGKVVEAHNRRYLGNKSSITEFIRTSLEKHCTDIKSVCDIFAGTGAVARAFSDKQLFVNDLLYSNFVANTCWFSSQTYRPQLVLKFVSVVNSISTDESNYMRTNFAGTYFAADDCSKIGVARELIECLNSKKYLIGKEYEILITVILYGMDRYANTVGHYDAYRKGASFREGVKFPLVLPSTSLNENNAVFNRDANQLIRNIQCDVLYLDPPYNSRQYSDAYHLLENVARWHKPDVHGVAKKMDRSGLKSAYNSVRAAEALRDLVTNAQCRYIAFSYNNMGKKGNARSNARITDEEIVEILSSRGLVQTYEISHKPFTTGKTKISDNTERLFICTVNQTEHFKQARVLSPINYIGGKGKLLPQLLPLLPPCETFVDVFAGGCNVGINAKANNVVLNDISQPLISLLEFLASEDTDSIIREIDLLSEFFNLSRTFESSYKAFDAESSKGLAEYNKPGFLKLRQAYNDLPPGDPLKNIYLYALIIFGFNNQIRFNSRGEFNLPVGKRDFNSKMRRKLSEFNTRAKEASLTFTVKDFRSLEIESFPVDTVFYCDPPYLITQATYNENGGWTPLDEKELLSFLDRVHESGRKFALSNVLEAKGCVNLYLKDWLESRPYTLNELSMSYSNSNYQRKGSGSKTREVLVTNY